jgi:hypothetical protein
LFYLLSIWQSLGAIYLAPDNGVVVSPGFDNDQDNGNSGVLGYIKDWVVRPTVSLFMLANIFKRDGKTRRIPLHKLYQVEGVEDSALTNILLGYQGKSWKLHTETYLLRRRRQLDDPDSAVPSDSVTRRGTTSLSALNGSLCDPHPLLTSIPGNKPRG